MSEKDILDGIRSECSELSESDFHSIRKSIETGSCEKADVIEYKNVVPSVFIKTAVAAAAVLLPVTAVVSFNNSHISSPEPDEGNPQIFVSTSVTESVTEGSKVTVSEKYETSAVTSAVISDYTVSSETVTEMTAALTSTEISSSSFESVKPSETESVQHVTEIFTEAAVSTALPVTEKSVTVSETAVTQAEITTETEAVTTTVTEVSETEYKPEVIIIPGKNDLAYTVMKNSSAADDKSVIYQGEDGEYKITDPERYTVFIYEVIVYGYDYFDFLHKGDMIMKSETAYTVDEIIRDNIAGLGIEDLIKAGLPAEKIS